MARDPVCKMEIDTNDAESESTYRGNKFYFCSEECKESFERSPEKYLEKGKKSAA